MTKQLTIMNKKKVAAGVLAIGVGLAAGATSVFAYGGFGGGQNLTEEQQEMRVQITELRESGNYTEARALAEESGFMKGKGQRAGERQQRMENSAAHEAIANNDYDAFVAAHAECDKADKTEITPEMFAAMVEAKELRDTGDRAGARVLLEEAGFPMKGKAERGNRGHGQGR